MIRNTILMITLFLVYTTTGNAQTTTTDTTRVTTLNGLHKAEKGDVDPNKPIQLNPKTTPAFSEDSTMLSQGEFMKMLMSGDYVPEPYINANKEIKAMVFRKATEEEKEKMKAIAESQLGKNKMIGKKALPFSAVDIKGKKYSLDNLKGKIVVINFWFTSCVPCMQEIPELNNLVAKYKGKDVVFLGFATDNKQRLKDFLKKRKFNYNIIADSKSIAELYKVSGYPTHLIIDKNSTVAHFVTGLGSNTVEGLDSKISSLLK